MQTVYLVKGIIQNRPEFLCGIHSKEELAENFIKESLKIHNETEYKVEKWLVDYHV